MAMQAHQHGGVVVHQLWVGGIEVQRLPQRRFGLATRVVRVSTLARIRDRLLRRPAPARRLLPARRSPGRAVRDDPATVRARYVWIGIERVAFARRVQPRDFSAPSPAASAAVTNWCTSGIDRGANAARRANAASANAGSSSVHVGAAKVGHASRLPGSQATAPQQRRRSRPRAPASIDNAPKASRACTRLGLIARTARYDRVAAAVSP